MSEILSAADVQSRLEDLCDVDGLNKTKKAREVYGVMETISTQNAALRAEVERLRKALAPFADPERYNTAEEECRENKAMRWCAVHSFRWPCPVGPARAALAAEEESNG